MSKLNSFKFMKQMAVGLVAAISLLLCTITNANNLFAVNSIDFHKIPTDRPVVIPPPPKLDANTYILVDFESGDILAEKNASTKVLPASITKLMTLYIIFNYLNTGQIKVDDKVRISKNAWRTGGSRMFIKVGTEVPVRELIEGIIVASGNDACVAMAEYIAGSEESFVSLMNQQAKLLGMQNTNYTDSTGMPHENHYTTTRDVAILIRALIHDFPQYYPMFAQRKIWHNGVEQPNRNRLLWHYKYADGLKTGHTEEAGYCLASSAKKAGQRLISVVMGAPSTQIRTSGTIQLYTYGFRFFETHKLYGGRTKVTESRVYMGSIKSVPLGLENDLYITIPKGSYNSLNATVELPNKLKAPIKKGKAYGSLHITLHGHELARRPLVALASDKEAGTWRRMMDYMDMNIKKYFKKSDK